MSGIGRNLRAALDRISAIYNEQQAADRLGASATSHAPRLVAVSKTKPKEMILEAYQAGQRHFGENYVQELLEKSNDPTVLELCPDIQWHFIGACQSKNIPKLVRCRRLCCVETVSSAKVADKIQSQLKAAEAGTPGGTVKVMIQVNTSGEANKGGAEPTETPGLARHIVDNCSLLEFVGLMTIGSVSNSLQSGEDNPDFISLVRCRREVAQELKVEEGSLELSMGMSADFEEAIRMGSTSVRIGSSIFGTRDYNSKPAAQDVTPTA